MADLRNSFGYRFSTLSRHWRRHIDQQLARHGINDATWATLIHLHKLGDGINQKQLAHAVGIEGPAQVRLIDILEKKGQVVRKPCTSDRRNKRLFLTAEGVSQVNIIHSHLRLIENKHLSNISDEQLATFHEVLEQIEKSLNQ